MTPTQPAIARIQRESSFRMGAPPVPGKEVTIGKSVSVGAPGVVVTVGVLVGTPGVVVTVGVLVGPPGVVVTVDVFVGTTGVLVTVGVSVGTTLQIGPVIKLVSNVT
jgi:hypothetical protein